MLRVDFFCRIAYNSRFQLFSVVFSCFQLFSVVFSCYGIMISVIGDWNWYLLNEQQQQQKTPSD